MRGWLRGLAGFEIAGGFGTTIGVSWVNGNTRLREKVPCE
jgi:hypothetical protein